MIPNRCAHEAATKLGRASSGGGTRDWWGLELHDGDQTEHHIRSQCSESFFISIEDYPLGGDNENFELPKESSSEKASIFRS